MNHTERPCAAHGWTSYRYGHIMTGLYENVTA